MTELSVVGHPLRDEASGIILQYGELCPSSFELWPIWREYKDPQELDRMRVDGASEEWIRVNILERLEEGDVWYALSHGGGMPPAEFVVVAAEIYLGQHQERGYVTLVNEVVASCTLFAHDVVLSTSDLLDEENAEGLAVIGRQREIGTGELLPVRYCLDSVVGLATPSSGRIDVPLPTPRASAQRDDTST